MHPKIHPNKPPNLIDPFKCPFFIYFYSSNLSNLTNIHIHIQKNPFQQKCFVLIPPTYFFFLQHPIIISSIHSNYIQQTVRQIGARHKGGIIVKERVGYFGASQLKRSLKLQKNKRKKKINPSRPATQNHLHFSCRESNSWKRKGGLCVFFFFCILLLFYFFFGLGSILRR